MRRVPRTLLGQMKAMQAVGQNRIVRGQQDQAAGPGSQGFRQRQAALRIARAHDHHAAFGQAERRGQGIGEALIVGDKNQQTRVERRGLSC